MTKDLVQGPPFQCIIRFTLPIFLGMLFQQFYNMVDTMIVGKFLGLDPLAGVGATSPLYFLVIGSCTGICSGFSIPIAHMFGAKDQVALRKLVANSAYLSVVISVIVTTVTLICCKPMLTVMDTPSDAYPYAYMYIGVIFAGIPFTILYNMTASIIRALGDSKTPVVFLIISSVLNIILDLFFILILHLNVAGASLATVISQGISGVICFLYMKKKFAILKMTKEERKPNRQYMRTLCVLGLPMGLQYSITAVGSIVMQAAVNGFGGIAVAGVAASQKLFLVLACPLESLGNAMATFAGQNIGAGRLDRVNRGLYLSTVSGLVLSVLLFFAVLLFGDGMTALFIDRSEVEAIEYAHIYNLVSTGFFPLLTFVFTVRFTIQGMGFSPAAMIAGVLEMFARCLVALVISKDLGFVGVCFANPAAWLAADLFLLPAFFYFRKKLLLHTESRKAA